MSEGIKRDSVDRRQKNFHVEHDQRGGTDRRIVPSDSNTIIGFMKKIPIFKGFSPIQYKKILTICSKRPLLKNQYLCHKGEDSNELFILITGSLRVVVRENIVVCNINPLGLVGEMGVFTDSQRSASVIAEDESTVIKIHKNDLFELLSKDHSLSTRLLLNVINDLSSKLNEDNEVIEMLRKKRQSRII